MSSSRILAGAVALALGACTTAPQGPSVRVMPAPGKPFEVFVSEDQQCRGWAAQSSGANNPNNPVNEAAVGSAIVGTAIGAAAGGLMGGNRGAAGGAGAGLLIGSAAGAGEASRGAYSTQRRYDIAYEQCMYSKGNLLPGQSLPYNAAPPPPPPPPPH